MSESLNEYTKKLDDNAEREGRTDTCDVCNKEVPWKELSWWGRSSCRICNSSAC
jgi:hypothetical protein